MRVGTAGRSFFPYLQRCAVFFSSHRRSRAGDVPLLARSTSTASQITEKARSSPRRGRTASGRECGHFGISGRQGVGKVRHLDLSYLWIQAAVRGRQNCPQEHTNRQQRGGHWNNSARQRVSRSRDTWMSLGSVRFDQWSLGTPGCERTAPYAPATGHAHLT